MGSTNDPPHILELGASDVGTTLDRWPKLARLDQLKRAGLPIPDGRILGLRSASADDVAQTFAELTAMADDARSTGKAPQLIARMALSGEDGPHQAFAGLSHSLAGIGSNEQLAAALTELQRLTTDKSFIHNLNTYVQLSSPTSPHPNALAAQVLVQRQVPRQCLVVVAQQGECHPWIETHDDSRFDALAAGLSPEYGGALGMWSHPAAIALAELIEQARTLLGPGDFEYECIIDPNDQPWLVQARPLTSRSERVDPEFIASMDAGGAEAPEPSRLRGLLTLDGEHNPAPLSPAHGWLMHELARQRPGRSGDPIVLAGWLYMQRLPRQLGQSAEVPSVKASPPSARACLQNLLDHGIPRARTDLSAYQNKLAGLSRSDCRSALDEALTLFLAMIDHYVRAVAPARNHYRQDYEAVAKPSAPLTLALRHQFLDVLPCAWDIAAPPLAEVLKTRSDDPPPPAIPNGETEAAALLGELDDHFFALGLAPVRALWLRVGQLTDLNRKDIFLCTGDELKAWSQGKHWLDDPLARASTLAARAERHKSQARLSPPQFLFDGQPVTPLTNSRAICIGNSCTGTWAHRDDLEQLLHDPPSAGAIVHLPTLCAQAAIALAQTQVRAVVTSYGGALSHGALMARELGINALIGFRLPLDFLEGQAVELDLDEGTLRALS